MPRRERWGIVGAVLAALEAEHAKGSAGRLSNVAARANIAYDRLQEYVEELVAAGLVTPARLPQLTPKGREFLRHYRQWLEVLERFGMPPSEVPRRGLGPRAGDHRSGAPP